MRRRQLRTAAVKWSLIAIALAFLFALLFVPLVAVFVQAFDRGLGVYFEALRHPDAISSIVLTLMTAMFVVPINLAFGVAAAWAVARFQFRGRQLVITLIDLPFAVSPVISGLIFVLLFGAQGLLGPWLEQRDIRIIFALPGIVLATMFVTVPFVARELIPVLQEQGAEDEEAALTLGASGWQMFRRVTLPNVKWALMYGVILLTARTVGEFGAVSVVSGHVRGQTNTIPLHVEILYNEYDFTAAFAVASVLTIIALLSLVGRQIIDWRAAGQPRAAGGRTKDFRYEHRAEGIPHSFGANAVLHDISLDVAPGELVGILGPSGSGKTTMLRVIAGLETPDPGDVDLCGDAATHQRVQERRVGFVFQHYALFKHLTVFENVAFGLRVRPRAARPAESVIRARVEELLALVQLEGLGNVSVAALGRTASARGAGACAGHRAEGAAAR